MKDKTGKPFVRRLLQGIVSRGSIDTDPDNNGTSTPISSSWAYEHEEDNDENIERCKNILLALVNAICNSDYSWDDFDTDEMDIEDITELIEDNL
jgi:hypothetical protein